jgi:hypothetical protein
MSLQRSTTGVCHTLLRFPTKEQDTLPIVFLISKEVIPYWTRGGTCCPGVSTPKIRSLADLSNHMSWWY